REPERLRRRDDGPGDARLPQGFRCGKRVTAHAGREQNQSNAKSSKIHFRSKPSSAANACSSFNSATLALIFAWLNSLMGRLWTVSSLSPSFRTGNEQTKPW